MGIRVEGYALPTGEPFELNIVGNVWVDENTLDLDLRVSGWIIPGLVDVHTHPGAAKPGDPIDEELLRQQLLKNMEDGVLAIRSPGLASTPPDWFGKDPQLPQSFHAGPWLAKPGQFISGWGKRVSDRDFPRVAAAQAGETGWCKIIGDWGIDDEPISPEVMLNIVAAVRAVGGRVAVHSQNTQGGSAAVRAGVDSLEHGMWLDESLLDLMRENKTALTPTLNVFESSVDHFRAKADSPKRDWYVQGCERHPELIRKAHEAGVTILAGTDSQAFTIVAEVQALARAGLSAEAAIASASWKARDFLGLASLKPGTSADALIYSQDPRQNLEILAYPEWIISRGKVMKRPQLS